MTTKQYAYSTTAPETVDAWRRTRADLAEYSQRVRASCAALGGNNGPLVRRGIWGSPDEIVGLEPDDSGQIPDGWRIVRNRLEPRQGKPGEAARAWLLEHQPPDMRHVLAEHGLPRHSSIPRDGIRFRLTTPALFELDGTLWACYQGEPGDRLLDDGNGCTWTPRALSEFYAAQEELERREATRMADA